MKIVGNYNSIPKTLKTAADWGREPGNLQAPKSLAIEEGSGNIYIADALNERIQVFDRNLSYCFYFPKENLRYPWGVCVKDSLVFVTQKKDNTVRIFHVDGTYVTGRENSKCHKNREFEYNIIDPLGIAVDLDNTTFVCDSGNKRILVLQPNLPNLAVIKIGDEVPVDIKMHPEYLVVLTTGDTTPGIKENKNMIKIISRSGEMVREMILSEINSNVAQFLALDQFDNLLVTSPEVGANITRTGALYIYSWKGELLKRVTDMFNNIKGIAIDANGNVVNVCEIPVGRLKILSV